MVSKHTEHSRDSSFDAFLLLMSAGYRTTEPRVVPAHFTEEDRRSFLAVAERAASEAVNCYTILSLGVQAYEANSVFIKKES